MTKQEVDKKIFVEVVVGVIPLFGSKVMLASQPLGAYDNVNEWGGIEELWP